jgi:hypothetical protein
MGPLTRSTSPSSRSPLHSFSRLSSARLYGVLLAVLSVFLVPGGRASAQYPGASCESCSEDRYNCYVAADYAFQDCRRNGGDESQCQNARETAEQACENTYSNCSASCDPGGVNRPPSLPTGCTDNGLGALTSLESNGYLSGWAMDGDAPSFNDIIVVAFYVDHPFNNTDADASGDAILRLPPGSGHGFSVVLPGRFRDGQVHTLYGYTWDPCYGMRHFWQGSPQTFVLTPGNPTDDPHTFVRQVYIDYYRREPDQPGWDQWTSLITACGSDAGCISGRRGQIAAAFFDSNEYMAWGAVPEITWTTKGTSQYNELFIQALYKTLLRRDPDASGSSFWLGVLNSYGSPTPQAGYDAVATAFTESGEYRDRFY